jgi:hypothetical protein
MNGIDLDNLKSKWHTQDRQINQALTLDISALRATLAQGTASALRRHQRGLFATVIMGGLLCVWLAWFLLTHRDDALYCAMALPILLLASAHVWVNATAWLVVRKLDLAAPIMQVQQSLEKLGERALWTTKWILWSSVLLWLPAVAVLCNSLLGFDLLRRLHPSVIWANIALGIVFIPLAMGVAKWMSAKWKNAPAYQRLLDDMAGRGLSVLRGKVQAQQQLEQRVASGAALPIVAPWSAVEIGVSNKLIRRLLLGIVFYALLILLTGSFNSTHGGYVQFLLPGLLLHAVWLSQMIGGIVHRNLLSQLHAAGSAESARISLQQMATVRSRIAGLIIALSPLLLLALAQVLTVAIFGIDLWHVGGALVGIVSIIVAAALSVFLFVLRRRTPETFAYRLINGMSFGVMATTNQLVEVLVKKH